MNDPDEQTDLGAKEQKRDHYRNFAELIEIAGPVNRGNPNHIQTNRNRREHYDESNGLRIHSHPHFYLRVQSFLKFV